MILFDEMPDVFRSMRLTRLLRPRQRDHPGGAALCGAPAQRILEINRDAMLLQQVGKGLVGELLKTRHSVPPQLPELVKVSSSKAISFRMVLDCLFRPADRRREASLSVEPNRLRRPSASVADFILPSSRRIECVRGPLCEVEQTWHCCAMPASGSGLLARANVAVLRSPCLAA